MKETSSLLDYIKHGAFFKTVVEDGSDIVFIVDYDGNILYNNHSVYELLGYPDGHLNGKCFFDFIDDETVEEFKTAFKKSIKKPYNESVEFRFLCADNTYKFFEFNSINLSHKEGLKGLILDCRDISQRKRDAAELLRAQKTKEQFLANMSHEIRTPINGIAGMVNLLSEATSEEDRQRYLNAIRNSTENLKVIISDILDLSVIESGKLKLEKIGFNIRYQLSAVVENFLMEARSKGIELSYSIDESANGVYIGDPVRLNQIMINLVGNSLKFTNKGFIKIHATCESIKDQIHNIKFTVSDSGVGIPEEKLPLIFDSFTQADETVTRRYGGTGLGLSIVKQLIEIQDGEISVKSKVDSGTTFYLNIPYTEGELRDLVHPGKVVNHSPAESLDGLRVLLVEDNDINRLYALNMLKKWDCVVESAENGYIAVEKLKSASYDIVLMDVQMPIMDGYEATRHIRKDGLTNIPIIALTANAIKGDNEKCLQAGMNDYLPKPFQPEDLYKTLVKFAPSRKSRKKKVSSKSTDKIQSQESLTNLDHLREVSSNDASFIQDMIETFLKNTPEQVSLLRDARAKEDWAVAAKVVHKMKPSVTFMGISVLKDSIRKILDYEKYPDELPALTEEVIKKMTAACEELNSHSSIPG
ncbi:PAS domain-containing hybrid sensor histidine kinase/response regulator [Fulvivirga sedimenti]|uniref:histidine kinase n=1 Tax=Fulvivirga sedimenti TaxID=2879465 RepID=A0A9X1KY87_9BACT|nr:response regulator [Fulvivirga sedimenti]MCA6073336.1 response regulator [Fulvivirga sedimenti]